MEIFVDAMTSELRIAEVDDCRLIDLDIHRPQDFCRAGAIILGRVKVVVPGLHGVFVDIGDTQDGFLPLSGKSAKTRLTEGQVVIVRVQRESMGDKGARLVMDDTTADSGAVPPFVLSTGPDPLQAVLERLIDGSVSEVVVEGVEVLAALKSHALAATHEGLRQHTGAEPIFDAYDVEHQIDAALEPIVPLTSGGRLHIHDTPACIAIDVDTGGGSATGGKADVTRSTNREAARAIAQALRLRNLSGNVVIDFVAARSRKDGAALLDQLGAETSSDPISTDIRGWSRLGFVELVRRRQSPSLASRLCTQVPVGDGGGRVKSPITLAYAALRRAGGVGRAAPGQPVTIQCPQSVYDTLKSDLAMDVCAVTDRLGSPLNIVIDAAMPVDRLDIYTGA